MPKLFVPGLDHVYKLCNIGFFRILYTANTVHSFAPLDLPDTPTGAGISALFDHYNIPPDFISQRLESVTHSFGAVNEGSSYCTS